MMARRISEEALRVEKARAKIAVEINELWEKHDLTAIEFLQALNTVEATVLKYMLRAERHPNDPDKSADE